MSSVHFPNQTTKKSSLPTGQREHKQSTSPFNMICTGDVNWPSELIQRQNSHRRYMIIPSTLYLNILHVVCPQWCDSKPGTGLCNKNDTTSFMCLVNLFIGSLNYTPTCRSYSRLVLECLLWCSSSLVTKPMLTKRVSGYQTAENCRHFLFQRPSAYGWYSFLCCLVTESGPEDGEHSWRLCGLGALIRKGTPGPKLHQPFVLRKALFW